MTGLRESLRELPHKLLVGVSGGMDSMALLHALIESGRKPVVLHFDHGWRAESATEAKWVRAEAQQGGLKFAGGKMKKSSRRSESEARAARYDFFAKTAQRLKISDLVLAHQADDQVETFLMQLFRGSGAAGRGMQPVSRRAGLIIHRPWLGVWRKEIEAYARQNRLEWREDASNDDVRHRRNLIRRRVLPYLSRTISPQIAANLWRGAEIARAEGEWMDSLCTKEASTAELSVKELRESPVGRQRRTVLRWLHGRNVRDIGFGDVEAVRGLALKDLPAKVNLSGGKFARRRAGRIFIEG